MMSRVRSPLRSASTGEATAPRIVRGVSGLDGAAGARVGVASGALGGAAAWCVARVGGGGGPSGLVRTRAEVRGGGGGPGGGWGGGGAGGGPGVMRGRGARVTPGQSQ